MPTRDSGGCPAGYALTIYIPTSLICILPMASLRWGLTAGATATSALFILANLRAPIFENVGAKCVPPPMCVHAHPSHRGVAIAVHCFQMPIMSRFYFACQRACPPHHLARRNQHLSKLPHYLGRRRKHACSLNVDREGESHAGPAAEGDSFNLFNLSKIKVVLRAASASSSSRKNKRRRATSDRGQL